LKHWSLIITNNDFCQKGNDAALQGYLTNLRNRVGEDEAQSMFEYLAVYNSSIKNDNSGDQQADNAARIDIGSLDANRRESVLTPVTNDGSRGRQNVAKDSKFPNTTGMASRADQRSTVEVSHEKKSRDDNSNRSFAVGYDSNTGDADSDKRIETRQSGTKSVHLQDQRVNVSSRLDHPASIMGEDVQVGPDAIGIKKTIQSIILNEKENISAVSEIEVDGLVESKKVDSDFPASRGFVLPYLPKTPTVGNSRSSNQSLDRFSGEDRSPISDKKAVDNNEIKVPEESTKKLRSAD
jgi:hypothetical protein